MEKIGIIAGEGKLPVELIEQLTLTQHPFAIASFSPLTFTQTLPPNASYQQFSLAQVGHVIRYFQAEEIRTLIMVGHIQRPRWQDLRPDSTGLLLMGRLAAHTLQGDDALLGVIIRFLEERGFTIIGLHDLAPILLTPQGVLSKKVPSKQQRADITLGVNILTQLGEFDVGQALIIEKGRVLAIEAAEGTDAMIQRAAALKKEEKGEGVLVKIAKPTQEMRVDLPTIGLQTLYYVEQAGFAGIAMEQEATVLLQRDAMILEADKQGLFLMGIDPLTERE